MSCLCVIVFFHIWALKIIIEFAIIISVLFVEEIGAPTLYRPPNTFFHPRHFLRYFVLYGSSSTINLYLVFGVWYVDLLSGSLFIL
jgi:hypothetical protein